MNRLFQRAAALCATLMAITYGSVTLADDAVVWQRWEQTLTSTASYGNAYRDVTLSVNFVSPTGRTVSGYGFWDGGSTFKIRALSTSRARGRGRPAVPTLPTQD